MAIPPTRSQGDSGHIQDHNDISTELAARLPLSGGTLTGALNGTSAVFSGTVSAATPTQNGHLANKSYVDTALASVGGVDGLTNVYKTSVTHTPSINVVPYGATYSSGPLVGNKNSFINLAITLPSGEFTTTPVVHVSTTQQAWHVSGGASSSTAAYVTAQNFSGWPGTNDGLVIGPLGVLQTVTINLIAFGND